MQEATLAVGATPPIPPPPTEPPKDDGPPAFFNGRLPPGQEPLISVMSMLQLGQNCPIGIPLGGQRHRDFEVEDLDFDIEMKLLEEKEKKRLFPAAFVTAVLCYCLKRIGGINFASMEREQKERFISEMYTSDVLYIYATLRRLNMGAEHFVKNKCPNCMLPVEFGANLDELDVYVLDSMPSEFCWMVKLAKALVIETAEGDKSAEALWVSPSKWGAMMGLTGGITMAQRQKMLVRHHIIATEPVLRVRDVPIAILDNHLSVPKKGLSKFDYEAMSESLAYNTPGLRFEITGKCKGYADKSGCGFEIVDEIDWRYDVFFKRSRPSRGRKKT